MLPVLLVPVYLTLLVPVARTIPIDNAVEGEPEIECSADSITVNFNTRNEFQGHVYVKGRFNEEGCRTDEKGRRVAGIKLGFSACGTKRERSLSPKGVFVSNTVVVTFHPQFLTKVDRAYTVQCFYMEADKTVSQELEVSEITTAFQSQTVPMPICRYDILDGTPTGQPVKYATIGQQVYHKWTCETEATDIFCALVHSCYVDDGAGNRAQLLNDKGCALDKFLLNNLEYQSDLMAGHEAHVFKYADKPALVFQCQITILIKEPGQPCVRPQCPEPGGLSPGGPSPGGPAETRPPPYSPTPPQSPLYSPTAPPLATRVLLDVVASVGTASTPPARRPTGVGTTARAASSPRPAISSFPPANGTRRDARPIQIRRDFSAFASRLLRRVRSVPSEPGVFDPTDALGTWDVSSQQITTLDIDASEDNSEVLRALNSRRPPGTSSFDNRQAYCLSRVSLGFMVAVSVGAFVGGVTTTMLLCRKERPEWK